MRERFACIVTEDKAVHPEKTPVPMLVTDPGILMDPRFVQFAKAPSPIVVTPEGIDTDVMVLLPLNAFDAIDVTLDGIVMAPPLPVYPVRFPFVIVNPVVVGSDANTMHGAIYTKRQIENNTVIIDLLILHATDLLIFTSFLLCYIYKLLLHSLNGADTDTLRLCNQTDGVSLL